MGLISPLSSIPQSNDNTVNASTIDIVSFNCFVMSIYDL